MSTHILSVQGDVNLTAPIVEESPGGHSSASHMVRFLKGAQIQALSQAARGRVFFWMHLPERPVSVGSI